MLKIDERDQSKSNYHYSYNRFYCNCILGSKYCLRFYVVENQNQPQQRCITWFNLRYTVACHCFIATVKCVYKRSVIIYRLRVGGEGGEGGTRLRHVFLVVSRGNLPDFPPLPRKVL